MVSLMWTGDTNLVKTILRRLAPIDFYRKHIWPRLPKTADHGTYNGVKITGTRPMYLKKTPAEVRHRILDEVIPWDTPSQIDEYKQTNLEQIRENYQAGDNVVIIGGGHGTTTVVSAQEVGPEGSVLVFEGDEHLAGDIRQTVAYNDVGDICEVQHAIVGEGYEVEAEGDASIVNPTDLPACDVLEMDCEGAELEILQTLTQRPRTMLVELHHKKSFAPYSSPTPIREELEKMGYSYERFNGVWVNGLLVATRG